jgi:hypothetical protein
LALNSDGPGAIYQLKLKAPSTHCSAVSYTVFDRNGFALQPSGGNQFINANRSITVPLGNNLTRGSHTFYIGAEGRVGGCNSGRVGSWSVYVTPQIVPQ